MRIGIVGPAERAVAWERHIRPHHIVKEVAIAPTLEEIGDIDACILLHEGQERLQILLDAIKMGFHSFLVSRLPRNTAKVRKIYHASEEANVCLQFSHWPTLSPLFQWMKNQIAQPSLVHISREIDYSAFMEMDIPFDYLWIDELAFSLKWINSSLHYTDAQPIHLSGTYNQALHIHLRFENGSTVTIWVNTTAESPSHRRIASDSRHLLDYDVRKQSIRFGRKGSGDNLFFEKKTFDDSESAKNAATQFLKAIQLRRSTPFNGFDAFNVCTTADEVMKKIN